MFSYYGSKSKIVHLYPPPKYGKIIEPFAGSARYSLRYWDKDVLLVDKFQDIVDVWNWLKICSKQDILSLPNINEDTDLRKLNLTNEQRILIGFCIGRGNTYPVNVCGNFQDWEGDKKRIANNLHKIKHWKILLADYTEIENQVATWFIDPPYFVGGHKYKFSEVNYNDLAKWSQLRLGQTIVCENTKATWLPFVPMGKMRGVQFTTTEAIWSNIPTNYDHFQMSLFPNVNYNPEPTQLTIDSDELQM